MILGLLVPLVPPVLLAPPDLLGQLVQLVRQELPDQLAPPELLAQLGPVQPEPPDP